MLRTSLLTFALRLELKAASHLICQNLTTLFAPISQKAEEDQFSSLSVKFVLLH